MAVDTEAAAPAPVEAAKAKIPVVPLILAIVLAVVLAVAGASGVLFYLVKSGKLPMPKAKPEIEVVTVIGPPKTHDVVLEPLLVNLADEGGRAYLRMTMTLSVIDPPPPPKGEKPKEEEKPPEKGKVVIEHDAELRDAALSVIGSETSESLLAPEGKEKLKEKLRAAIKERLPEMKVADLFFTEFLVQR